MFENYLFYDTISENSGWKKSIHGLVISIIEYNKTTLLPFIFTDYQSLFMNHHSLQARVCAFLFENTLQKVLAIFAYIYSAMYNKYTYEYIYICIIVKARF